MDSPALRDLTQRVRGPGMAVAGGISLDAVLGRLNRQLERAEKLEQRMQRAVQPFIMPAVRFPVAGGVLTYDPAAQSLGPEDGQAWFMERLTVWGLVAGGGTAVAAEGAVAAPGGNTIIATIPSTSIVPGTYMVYWSVALTAGAPAAGTDSNNFQLKYPPTTSLLVSVNPAALGSYGQDVYGPIQVPAGNANAVQVRSVNAATAGVTYAAQISLVPVAGDQVTLYREIGGAGGGNPQNALHTFTPPGSGPGPEWKPGSKGLILRSPEQLLLAGSNLAASGVMLSGEGIAVEDEFIWRYCM